MTDTKISWILDDLLAWAEETIGSSITAADHTWPHDSSLVLELVDAEGAHYFLKHPRDPHRFARETRAYRTTLMTFGDLVPQLVGVSDTYQCLLLRAVPGQLARGSDGGKDPDVHRQAGALLSRLHRSDWPEPSPEMGEQLKKQRAKVLERAKDLLDPSDFRFVRRATAALTKPALPSTVPCHRDYWPRNWMVGPDGILRVIDFGRSERDLAVQDFVLLSQREWVGRPHLRAAFFEGYGRQLGPHEQAQLEGFVTIAAMAKVVRASKRGNQPMMARARQAFHRLNPSPDDS